MVILYMSTLSIPLNNELEEFMEDQVESGRSESKAAVVRKALRLLAEQEAVLSVLKAEQEPTISGGLDDLAKSCASLYR